MPGSSVIHYLPEVSQILVQWVTWWCFLIISSLVILFSSCLQYFPVLESLPMSRLFASGGQSIGALASVSVLPMNIQGWFPLGLTSLISLQSKGLLRVFSSTTVQKHEFSGAQPSLWTNSHIYTWLLEKPWLWPYRPIGLFWWLSGKESVCHFRRHRSGRSSGEGNESPFQYSCLGNPMDRGTWLATFHGVAKQSDKTEWLNNNKTITLTYRMILGRGK